MAGSIEEAKNALRSAMRARRRSLAETDQFAAGQAISAHLGRIFHPDPALDLLGTCAYGGEIDPSDYLARWCQAGGRLLLPRVLGPGLMEWRHATDLGQCVPGFRGIPEPDPARCPVEEPAPGALILVPGLAFDRQGRRLGQGGGYYDRLLSDRPAGAVVVGICHDFQLVECVPIDPATDQSVDWVVTPRGTHRCPASS